MLPKLHGTSFDFSTWRAYSFPIPNRENAILSFSSFFRAHAVGYSPGDGVVCRPKPDTIAIMLLLNGDFQWTHLTLTEFYSIWGNDYET